MSSESNHHKKILRDNEAAERRLQQALSSLRKSTEAARELVRSDAIRAELRLRSRGVQG